MLGRIAFLVAVLSPIVSLGQTQQEIRWPNGFDLTKAQNGEWQLIELRDPQAPTPPPPPPPSGTLAAIQAATPTQTTSSGSYVDIPGQTLSGLVAGDTYLVLARNRINRNGGDCATRIAGFPESELATNIYSPTNSLSYAWFGVVSSDGAPITQQFRGDGGNTVRVHSNRLIALDLSPLPVGDYLAAQASPDLPLGTAWSDGATTTFTPSTPGTYLVLAYAQVETSSSDDVIFSQIEVDGQAAVGVQQEGKVKAGVVRRRIVTSAWAMQLDGTSHTIKERTRSGPSAAHTRLHSSLFVLRLDSFASWSAQYGTAEVDLPATEYGADLLVGSLDVTSAADVLYFGSVVADINGNGHSLGRTRLFVDGAGVLADSEDTCTGFDSSDEQANLLWHVKPATVGTHDFLLQASDNPGAPDAALRAEDYVSVAFAVDLGGGSTSGGGTTSPPTSGIAVESLTPLPSGDVGLTLDGATYTITTDFDPGGDVWLASPDITLVIDGTLRQSVQTYLDWDDGGIFGKEPQPDNCTIKGTGSVVTTGEACLRGRRSCGLTIEGVKLEATGPDAGCVRFASGPTTLRNVVCVANLQGVTNRHALPSVVAGGRLDMDGCVLLGGQVGSKGGGHIRNCFYSQTGQHTNPWAHVFSNNNDSIFEDNVFVQRNARGVIIQGLSGGSSSNNLVRDNVGFAKENPSLNPEYGYGQLTAGCIKTRNAHFGNRIEGNDFLSFAGGVYAGGCTVWLRNNRDAGDTITGNWCGAIQVGDPVNAAMCRAVALGWSRAGNQTNRTTDVIEHNVLISNYHTVSPAVDTDAWQSFVNAAIKDNVIATQADGSTIYAAWRSKLSTRLSTLPAYHLAKTEIDAIVSALDAEMVAAARYRAPATWNVHADGVPFQSGCDLLIEGSGTSLTVFTREHSSTYPISVTVQ